MVPLLPSELHIYRPQLATYFNDTNFTPDFPRTATIARAMWRAQTGSNLDGVLGMDAVTLSYLLRATGPVQVPTGPPLTSANSTEQILNGIYLQQPVPTLQDAYFRDVARGVLAALTSGPPQPGELVRGLGQAVEEGRVNAAFFDAHTQDAITGTQLAGAFRASPSTPQLALTTDDAAGSKMSYYLSTQLHVTPRQCGSNGALYASTATFSSSAPEGLPESVTGPGTFGTPRGEQLVLVRVYGPAGGKIGDFRFDGKTIPVPVYDDDGRPVAVTVVLLRSR